MFLGSGASNVCANLKEKWVYKYAHCDQAWLSDTSSLYNTTAAVSITFFTALCGDLGSKYPEVEFTCRRVYIYIMQSEMWHTEISYLALRYLVVIIRMYNDT